MSITRDRGFIVYECDHCHETLETETKEFDEATKAAKDEAWLTRPLGRLWFNFCGPGCLRDFIAKKGVAR